MVAVCHHRNRLRPLLLSVLLKNELSRQGWLFNLADAIAQERLVGRGLGFWKQLVVAKVWLGEFDFWDGKTISRSIIHDFLRITRLQLICALRFERSTRIWHRNSQRVFLWQFNENVVLSLPAGFNLGQRRSIGSFLFNHQDCSKPSGLQRIF